MQISIKNNRGVNVEGSKVAIAFDSSSLGEDPFEAIEVSRGVSQVEMQGLLSDPRFNNSTIRAHRRLYAIPVQGVGMQASHQGNMIASTTAQSGELTQRQSIFGASTPTIGITDNKGQVSFSFKVKPKVMSGTRPVSGRLLVTADVPTVDAEGKPINPPSSETQYINFQIIPDGRQLDTTGLSANTTSVTFNTNTTKQTIEKSFSITTDSDYLTFAGTNREQTLTIRVAPSKPRQNDIAIGIQVIGSTDSATNLFDESVRISKGKIVGHPTLPKLTALCSSEGEVAITFRAIANTGNGFIKITCEDSSEHRVYFELTL